MTPSISDLLASSRERLRDAAREALGELVVPRRILGVARAPRIVPAGTAWHLGVLLLTDDSLLATGDIVRARHDAPRGYTAQSQRERSELAAAAFRGGFPEGAAVHIGWRALDVDAIESGVPVDVLSMQDRVPSVRWSARGGWMPLQRYLDERVDLVLHPPGGAT